MRTTAGQVSHYCTLFVILVCVSITAADDGKPVSISAKIVPHKTDENRSRVVVQLDIEEGWHTYDQVAEGNPSPTTNVDLVLSEGVKTIGHWKRPAGVPYSKDPSTMIFEGPVIFSREIEVKQTNVAYEIGVEVRYQVCDEQMCMPPETFEVKLTIPAIADSDGKMATAKVVLEAHIEEATEPAKFTNKYFQAPIRLLVDGAPLNSKAKQKYPSPAVFDVDGDGQAELVVGDIFGSLNVYENENDSKQGDPVWGEHSPLKTADGKKIKVSNW